MTIENLIDTTTGLQGNLTRGNSIYISSSNIDYFSKLICETDGKHGILITPYLIIENGALYELNYYEFDIEVKYEKSHYNEYNYQNLLPKEITKNLKPQAIVCVGDVAFYQKVVTWYLKNMQNMTFFDIITQNPELKNAKLYYQIFMGSNEF